MAWGQSSSSEAGDLVPLFGLVLGMNLPDALGQYQRGGHGHTGLQDHSPAFAGEPDMPISHSDGHLVHVKAPSLHSHSPQSLEAEVSPCGLTKPSTDMVKTAFNGMYA